MRAGPARSPIVAAAVAACVPALVAVMLAFLPATAEAACGTRTVRTPHATWAMTFDPTTCAPAHLGEDWAGEDYRAITVVGATYVSVGQTARDPYTSGRPEWATWTSATGSDWAAHPAPFSASQLETGVALRSRGSTAVLVGAGFTARSTDGATWDVGPLPPPASARVTALVGGARWIAAGQASKSSGRAAAWTSTDGLTWSAVPDQVAFGRFCVLAAAARPGRYVLTGSDCHDRPVTLASPDGRTWTRSPSQAAFARLGVVRDVLATSTGFLAAGEDRSSSGARGTAFWCSTDGLRWRRLAFFPAAAWTETFVRLVRTPAGYYGLGSIGEVTEGLPPSGFYSPTGTTWSRDGKLPNPGFGSEDGDWMTDAAAIGNRIVAVGRYNDPDPGHYHAGGVLWIGDVRR